MFFTDTHMIYLCSNRALEEKTIAALLRQNIPGERLGRAHLHPGQ